MRRAALAAGSLLAAALLACAGAPRKEAPASASPPQPPFSPRSKSRAAIALGARELACDPERVIVNEYPAVVQIIGCGRVIYFEKKSKTQWERVGPEYELAPENDPSNPGSPSQEQVAMGRPVRTGGKDPVVTWEQMKQFHTFNPRAQAFCVLGVDGKLYACLVRAEEPIVAQAVADTLPTRVYTPATAQGAPVAISYVVRIVIKVPINCYSLSSPMQRAQCERAVRAATLAESEEAKEGEFLRDAAETSPGR